MNPELLPLAKSIWTSLPQYAQLVRDVRTISPTQATAQNTIVSRAYVEESLSRSEITPNLLKALQSIYAGMILMMLQRSNEVVAGRTVSDTLNKVYTRGMGIEAFVDVEADLDDTRAALEALRPEDTSEGMRLLNMISDVPGTEDDNDDDHRDMGQLKADSMGGTIAPPDLLPVGQVIKVSLVGRDNDGKAVKNDVVLAVRMTPYIVNDKAMEVIVSQGYKPNFKMRWMQWKAGEISFWKDFLFQADRIKKMEDAARADRSGAFSSFMSDTTRRDKDRLLDVMYNLPNPAALSNNLANSVIIVTEDTVKRAAADTGFNLMNVSQRQKFFNGSYVMMLVVVDENYHSVTIYMNGYEAPQQYAFTDFSPKKKADASDFMQMFATLAGNNRSARF